MFTILVTDTQTPLGQVVYFQHRGSRCIIKLPCLVPCVWCTRWELGVTGYIHSSQKVVDGRQYSQFLPQGALTGLPRHASIHYQYIQSKRASLASTQTLKSCTRNSWSCKEHKDKYQNIQWDRFLSFCFCLRHSASTLISFNSSSHFCSFRWTDYVNLLSKKICAERQNGSI